MNWENGLGKFLVGLGIFGAFGLGILAREFLWGFCCGKFLVGLGVFGGREFLGVLAQNMAKMPQNRLFLAIVAIETIY